jgi:hypothetical protein
LMQRFWCTTRPSSGFYPDGEGEEEWFAGGANNQFFAMKLQRMSHPAFCCS